jgi:hypothetical protein
LNGFLKLGKTIGKGAFCKVKRAVGTFLDENEEPIEEVYAVKVYNKEELRKKICTYHDTNGLL